jgi:hypothetical protein
MDKTDIERKIRKIPIEARRTKLLHQLETDTLPPNIEQILDKALKVLAKADIDSVNAVLRGTAFLKRRAVRTISNLPNFLLNSEQIAQLTTLLPTCTIKEMPNTVFTIIGKKQNDFIGIIVKSELKLPYNIPILNQNFDTLVAFLVTYKNQIVFI